jgi:hypothetical protein
MAEMSKRCLYYSQSEICHELATATGLCHKHESEYQQYVKTEHKRLRLAAEAMVNSTFGRRGGLSNSN